MSCCTPVGAPPKDLYANNIAAQHICVGDSLNVCRTLVAGRIVVPTPVPGGDAAVAAALPAVVIGPSGIEGAIGPAGLSIVGPAGAVGSIGPQGIQGIPGVGAVTALGFFYGLTSGTGNGGPNDYAATIANGTAVPFPRNGPSVGGIVRTGPATFVLPLIGTYEANWQVQTTEPGQLQLTLNGTPLPESTAGRQTATSGGNQIVGQVVFVTSAPNSIVSVFNPAGNTPALTVTPASGSSTWANSASLSLKKLA